MNSTAAVPGAYDPERFVGVSAGVARIAALVYSAGVCVVFACVCNAVLAYQLNGRCSGNINKLTRRRPSFIGPVVAMATLNVASSLVNGGALLANIAATEWRYGDTLCTLHAACIEIDSLLTSFLIAYSCFERLSSSPGCSPTLPSTRRVRLSAAVCSLLLFTAGLEAVQATASSSPTSLPLAAYYTCAYADTALQYCVPAIGYAAPYAFSLAAAAYAARHRRARAPATAASADIYRLIVVLALPATQAPFLIGQRLAAAAAGSRQPRYSSGLAVAVTLLRFSQPLVLPLVAGAAWLRGVGRPRSPQRLRGSPLAASGRLTLYADAGGLRLMNDASATSATSACDTPSPSTGTTSTTIATTIATIATTTTTTTTTATTTAATPSDGDAETYPQCLRSSSELRTCSDADDDDNSGLSARTVSPIRSKRKKSANYLSKMIANVDRADAPDVVPTVDLPSARSRRDRGSDVDGNASRPQIKKKKKRYRQPTCVENISGEADRAERGECSGEGQFEDCDDDNSLRRLPADLSTQPLSGALSQQLASSSPEGPTTAFSQPQTLSTPAPRICKQDSPTPQLDANETQSHFKKKTKKRKRTKFKKHSGVGSELNATT